VTVLVHSTPVCQERGCMPLCSRSTRLSSPQHLSHLNRRAVAETPQMSTVLGSYGDLKTTALLSCSFKTMRTMVELQGKVGQSDACKNT
jgi:hypothetical protein